MEGGIRAKKDCWFFASDFAFFVFSVCFIPFILLILSSQSSLAFIIRCCIFILLFDDDDDNSSFSALLFLDFYVFSSGREFLER